MAALYVGIAMVPLNKFDLKAIENLEEASDEEVLANADELLVLLQDKNWPIYAGVINRLLPIGGSLVEPISKVLKGNDSIWKSWIVHDLIGGFDSQVQSLYAPVLNEMLLSASQDDYREGLIDYVEIQLSKIEGNV
jgi:hypothetical protein